MANRVGDTPDLGPKDLCASCVYNMTIEGRHYRERYKNCSMLGRGGPQWVVKKCNKYDEKATHISLDDLYAMAWVLRTDKRLQKVGFTPPETEQKRWRNE